jgi:chemosensory pili system protein ChpC
MIDKAATEEIHAVLLSLHKDTLLLPKLAIVEVASREGLQTRPSAPAWFAGMLDWQGSQLPVIRFEGLGDRPLEEVGKRALVAVLNGVGAGLPGGKFGLLCEGHPHLIKLNRGALAPLPKRAEDRPEFVVARVSVSGNDAAIPNLQHIEQELARVLESIAV